ncbi:hypothetical protein PR202_ga25343 [Eleusine coracana subsp. coracana]|uniref:Uncharacterized protein n=1 Tax=Eleusine coracana subsp. coracana TaxID=191504 RepID=A0AAV5DB43_ELECO|nr:hypothetical protein PR202_ga25343 [Eleusine coracana subsp. coracana]
MLSSAPSPALARARVVARSRPTPSPCAISSRSCSVSSSTPSCRRLAPSLRALASHLNPLPLAALRHAVGPLLEGRRDPLPLAALLTRGLTAAGHRGRKMILVAIMAELLEEYTAAVARAVERLLSAAPRGILPRRVRFLVLPPPS